jgi:3D-(3,5/4)-trihydroxycyclohexane-1,2-dione acylhydrolase (decyclizing)
MVGDGSYLMMNSEIATSVAMGLKLTIVLLDNGGFGCINRLQQATGGAPFNNLVPHGVDLRAHAASLGALSERVSSLAELEDAMRRAQTASRTSVIVVETDPACQHGGWRTLVGRRGPGSVGAAEVQAARAAYDAARAAREGLE